MAPLSCYSLCDKIMKNFTFPTFLPLLHYFILPLTKAVTLWQIMPEIVIAVIFSIAGKLKLLTLAQDLRD